MSGHAWILLPSKLSSFRVSRFVIELKSPCRPLLLRAGKEQHWQTPVRLAPHNVYTYFCVPFSHRLLLMTGLSHACTHHRAECLCMVSVCVCMHMRVVPLQPRVALLSHIMLT